MTLERHEARLYPGQIVGPTKAVVLNEENGRELHQDPDTALNATEFSMFSLLKYG
jgi:hypothetical protein